MAIPLLGLLAVQGARTIATRIAGSAATRRKVANILAKNFKKAQKESLSKGKIPTDKTLTQGLTKDQKGLLSNLTPKTTSQVPGQPINLLDKTPTASTFGQRIGTGGERIVLPRRGYTQRYSDAGKLLPATRGSNLPVPVGQNAAIANQANASISRAAINAQREAAIKSRQAAYGRSPITQTADAGMFGAGRGKTMQTMGVPGGLLTAGGLGYAAMGIPDMFNNEVAQPQVPAPQPTVEAAPRFMQVINPGYDSTGKEVLNAALLRAGLRMAGGGNLRQTLDAAASVADSRNIFKTGEEALAAGRRNLGEAADIGIKQNADGTYSYSGALEGDPVAQMDNLVNSAQRKQTKGQPKIITKQVLEIAMRANPSKTEEEVISELEKVGFTNPEG
jgi:hypothetical protein